MKEEGSGASSQKRTYFLSAFYFVLFSLPCHQFLAKFKGFFVFVVEGKSMHCLFFFPSHHHFFIEAEWSGEENTLLFC